jgi:hypothetical protein
MNTEEMRAVRVGAFSGCGDRLDGGKGGGNSGGHGGGQKGSDAMMSGETGHRSKGSRVGVHCVSAKRAMNVDIHKAGKNGAATGIEGGDIRSLGSSSACGETGDGRTGNCELGRQKFIVDGNASVVNEEGRIGHLQ